MDSAISTPHRAPTHTRAKRREVQQNAQMHEKVEAQYKARKMRVIKLKEEVFTNHRVLNVNIFPSAHHDGITVSRTFCESKPLSKPLSTHPNLFVDALAAEEQ